MNKIIKENQNGFTLIEIMIAITVFAIGILGVAAMQIAAIEGNSSANGLTEAAAIGQDKIEELMALDYNNNALNDTDGDGTNGLRDPLPPPPLPQVPDSVTYPPDYQLTSGPYTISWNIAVNVPGTNTKTIRVIVIWNENGRNRLVNIDAIKAPL